MHVWTASSDKTIKVLDAATGKTLKQLIQHGGFVRCMGRVSRMLCMSAAATHLKSSVLSLVS